MIERVGWQAWVLFAVVVGVVSTGCGKKCTDACHYGARSCSGNGTISCDEGPDGCLAWSTPTPCGADQVCKDGYCKTDVNCASFADCSSCIDGSHRACDWCTGVDICVSSGDTGCQRQGGRYLVDSEGCAPYAACGTCTAGDVFGYSSTACGDLGKRYLCDCSNGGTPRSTDCDQTLGSANTCCN